MCDAETNLELASKGWHRRVSQHFVRSRAPLLLGLAVEILVVEVDDLLVDVVGGEDPDGLRTVNRLIHTPSIFAATWHNV